MLCIEFRVRELAAASVGPKRHSNCGNLRYKTQQTHKNYRILIEEASRFVGADCEQRFIGVPGERAHFAAVTADVNREGRKIQLNNDFSLIKKKVACARVTNLAIVTKEIKTTRRIVSKQRA